MKSPLARRIAWQLVPAFIAGAALLLGVSAWIGQVTLRHEVEQSSLRMVSLFESSLHNAMLKRDLDGLARLVAQLGTLPGVQSAELLTPAGEVRFASSGERRGQNRAALLEGLCLHSRCGTVSDARLTWLRGGPGDRLRVVHPVRNQSACIGCHGQPAAHPVNGVLLLDFASNESGLIARGAAGRQLLPAALLVLAALGAWVAWVLRRTVLEPVASLGAVMQRFGAGELHARQSRVGDDELAQLGQGFDRMAGQIQTQLAALAGHGAFLQSLLDGSPDAMLLIGEDHRIVMANAAYARLIGRRVEDIVGQPCYRASRGRSEPCPATLVHCPLVECRRTGAAVRAVMDFTAADGQRVDVELDAAPVRDPQNRWQVVEVIRPLQERVRFSQEQRLSAIGQLANGVAHEIHNPLVSIRLALQSCLRGLADGGLARDELEHYLRVVDQQIDRCVHITQRLMRLSEPSSETPLPVSVSSAVDDVLTVLGEEFRRAAVRVHVDLREPGLRALGDEGELRQVLVNVLQNSVHAMPHGGDVHISAWREEGQVHMSVQDSGVGIKSERLALIFLPFYSRRADGQHGTGLGLAICKSLLEQRGGWIRAHSTPGHGTRIEWALPDADARAQERKP